jgi:integrase
VKTGHLELSPLDEMEAPKKDERLPAWLTAEELSRLLEYIQWHGENVQDAAGRMPDVAWLRDAILVCLSCGLRRGEIAALRWEHVDLERGMIHVQHGEDFRTKSGAERVVPVRGKALERLRGQAEEAEGTPTGPVITDRRGLPVKPDRYTRVFKRMVRGAKLRNRERLNFHSLRHSCGAWLASQGVSERIIQEVLGHASTQTTQIYSHVAGSAVEGAMERVFGGK